MPVEQQHGATHRFTDIFEKEYEGATTFFARLYPVVTSRVNRSKRASLIFARLFNFM